MSRAFAIKRKERERGGGERGEKGMMRSRGDSFGVVNESNSSFSLLHSNETDSTQTVIGSVRQEGQVIFGE